MLEIVGRFELFDVGDVNEACFEAVVCCNRCAGEPTAKEYCEDIMGAQAAAGFMDDNVVDIDETEYFSFDTGFFADFAQGC